MKYIFYLLMALFLGFAAPESLAQARLVLNGASIILSNGGKLVIDNPSPDAIVAGSGGIITNGEHDNIIWKTGNEAGTYSFPFSGSNGENLSTTFTKSAGTGSGYYKLSSYATPTWENSLYLPAGILHVSDSNGNDMSGQIADRFWEVTAVGYTEKPLLTNLTITYADRDISASRNTILEQDLRPLQWNSNRSEWREFAEYAVLDTASNSVTIDSLQPGQQYSYWMLAGSSAMVLPVKFISFTALANGTQADLAWQTSSEENNDYFVVERSANGKVYSEVTKEKGAGTTHTRSSYSATDLAPLPGISYYRIKQVDLDGKFAYTPVRSVVFGGAEAKVSFYPNPARSYQDIGLYNWAAQTVTVQLSDLQGRVLLARQVKLTGEASKTIRIDFPAVANGAYVLHISGQEKSVTNKLLINN